MHFQAATTAIKNRQLQYVPTSAITATQYSFTYPQMVITRCSQQMDMSMEKSSSLRVMAGDDDEPCIQMSEQRQRTRRTNLHKLRNDSKTIRNQALSIEIPMF